MFSVFYCDGAAHAILTMGERSHQESRSQVSDSCVSRKFHISDQVCTRTCSDDY